MACGTELLLEAEVGRFTLTALWQNRQGILGQNFPRPVSIKKKKGGHRPEG